MPELNGLGLLNKMKKLNGFLRTILMSAYEVQNDKIFFQEVKKGIIDKFLKKPISITALRKEVNNQTHAYKLSAILLNKHMINLSLISSLISGLIPYWFNNKKCTDARNVENNYRDFLNLVYPH